MVGEEGGRGVCKSQISSLNFGYRKKTLTTELIIVPCWYKYEYKDIESTSPEFQVNLFIGYCEKI